MMRSLYSGVSGLKTHQIKMDVLGNNIANVNTTAYKASSITFSELMSQTTQRASGPNATTGTGGTNARQIGLGVRSGAINVNIATQGASQSTGNPFDVMITGDAFFVVNNGNENFFTRDGSFYVDGAGNLAMTSTGYNVMGWGVDQATGNVKRDNVAALRIMSTANMTYPPEATSKATVSGILDQNDKEVTGPNGKVINLNFYDNLGYSYTAKFKFKQSADSSEYSLELDKILDSEGKEVDISALTFGQKNRLQEKAEKITFDTAGYSWDSTDPTKVQLKAADGSTVADLSQMFKNDGTLQPLDTVITGVTPALTVGQALDNLAKAHGYEGNTEAFLKLYKKDGTNNVSVQEMLSNLALNKANSPHFPMGSTAVPSFEVDGRFYDGTTIKYDKDNGKFAGIGGIATQNTVTMGLSALGGKFSDIVVDFSDSSMLDKKGTSTISATSGDEDGVGAGRRVGEMIGVSIQSNGMIYASYDSGMTRLLGQIATAEFANSSGLEKKGDNLYSATLNSGDFDGVGSDLTANGGYMSTGQLEMSNVDLSSEFTEMITTQRGFQANSRIITVSDTLLEELTNLKR